MKSLAPRLYSYDLKPLVISKSRNGLVELEIQEKICKSNIT